MARHPIFTIFNLGADIKFFQYLLLNHKDEWGTTLTRDRFERIWRRNSLTIMHYMRACTGPLWVRVRDSRPGGGDLRVGVGAGLWAVRLLPPPPPSRPLLPQHLRIYRTHRQLALSNKTVSYITVLRIHDILVWIRIRGSMPLTNGSGSCFFHH